MILIPDENDRSSQCENTGTADDPQSEALLPELEQAEVIYYAYDPLTYEVLCRPGQSLSQKKAQRLQALNLYAHVIKFAEQHSP